MDLTGGEITGMVGPSLGTGTALWFFIRHWINGTKGRLDKLETKMEIQQAELLKAIQKIELQLAEAGIKQTHEDVDKIKEKVTIMDQKMQAAWRTLERIGGRPNRTSDQ